MKESKAVIGGWKGHNMLESGLEGRTLGRTFEDIDNILRTLYLT